MHCRGRQMSTYQVTGTSLTRYPLLDPPVGCIAKSIGFIPMQERLNLGHVAHVGDGANHRMH